MYNIGNVALSIGNIEVTGSGLPTCSTNDCPVADPQSFAIVADNCSSKTIGQSVSCTIEIIFRPKTADRLIASLRIPSNDPDSPITNVTMNGTGTISTILVSPWSYNFGNIPLGNQSEPAIFTISNFNNEDLLIGLLSISGNDASQFMKQNDTCSSRVLTPSTSCTVEVVSSPMSRGSFTAILNIPSDDLDEPNVTASLQGGSGIDLTGTWTSLVHLCSTAKCKVNGKFVVQNIGNGNAPSSLVRFYLSENDTYDVGDIFLKGLKTGTIKVGKSKKMSLSCNLPPGMAAIDGYIIAVIDEDDTVLEANETNNIIEYGPIVRANLAGEWILLTQLCSGTKCKITGTLNIKNTGNEKAASNIVKFYLSDDDTYDIGDAWLKQLSSGTVMAGTNKNKKLSFPVPTGVIANGKYIIAVIDAENKVDEDNEGDNIVVFGPIP